MQQRVWLGPAPFVWTREALDWLPHRAGFTGERCDDTIDKEAECGAIGVPVCGGSTSSADVAQLVEQLIRNQQVIGSSPIVGSSLISFLYPKDLPQELDTAGSLCGQCASIHKADSRGSAFVFPEDEYFRPWELPES